MADNQKKDDLVWGIVKMSLTMVLLTIAAVIDAIQALLDAIFIGFLLNPFISLFALILFTLMYAFMGVRFTSVRIASLLGTGLLEASPVGFLPLWTMSVIWTSFGDKIMEMVKRAMAKAYASLGSKSTPRLYKTVTSTRNSAPQTRPMQQGRSWDLAGKAGAPRTRQDDQGGHERT